MLSHKPKLNIEALQLAKEKLELKNDVTIWTRHAVHIGGRYHYYRDNKHFITVARMGVLNMTKTVWHELTHAQQVERLGEKAFAALYRAQLAELGLSPNSIASGKAIDLRYREMPLEKEADSNEKYAIKFPLIYEYAYLRKTVRGKSLQAVELDI